MFEKGSLKTLRTPSGWKRRNTSKPSTASWKTKIKAEWSRTRGPVICPSSAPSFGPNSTGQRMGPSVQEGTNANPGIFKERVLLHLEAERVPLCEQRLWATPENQGGNRDRDDQGNWGVKIYRVLESPSCSEISLLAVKTRWDSSTIRTVPQPVLGLARMWYV